jgi:RNA polymerase sigma-70 factor (family 1)
MLPAYSSYSDGDLVSLLKQGDLAAFTEIHSRFYPVLYSHAYRKLPEREEVKDLLQELFTYLWDNRAYLSMEVSLSAYLYSSVRNKILNIYKHNKIKSDYIASFQDFSVNYETGAEESIRIKELLAIVEAEVVKFPPQMRLIFELSRNNHLSHQEIAGKLNISPLTVRKQINNSLKILRVKLGANFFVIFF